MNSFWWKYFNSSERVLSKATASHSTIRFRALPWPLNWCLITSMKHETLLSYILYKIDLICVGNRLLVELTRNLFIARRMSVCRNTNLAATNLRRKHTGRFWFEYRLYFDLCTFFLILRSFCENWGSSIIMERNWNVILGNFLSKVHNFWYERK